MVRYDLRRYRQAAAFRPNVNMDCLSFVETTLGSGGRGQ
jgi:hypothetical protein